ncbi:MAG: 50S ribosomal protein L25 [Deferribacteres bacterium]|nr:50S ribosomal protein L25 [candidate division KSB1 bacterium]MCB9510405.1 50S ribosomal protein L25 [Deferribacteres bacterium]
MSEVALTVSAREKVGKSESRRLRREGLVPGVYYFHGKEAKHFAVDAKVLRGILASDSNVVDIKLGKGKALPSIIKEVQKDPISGRLLHIDFMGVNLDEKVVVEVPVHVVGTAAGAKAGGILQVLLRHLEVECLPLDIPDAIEVDVSALEINDSVNVSAIEAGEFTIITDADATIASVLPPRLEEEVEEEEVDEEAEPEVVGKGKKEGEEDGDEE